MTALTDHFTIEEMQCPCCKECDMKQEFMLSLEKLRIAFDGILKINSGFRCAKHNATLKNASANSVHLYGMAADISWVEFNAWIKRHLLFIALANFDGIGIGETYIHVDLGRNKKLWIY